MVIGAGVLWASTSQRLSETNPYGIGGNIDLETAAKILGGELAAAIGVHDTSGSMGVNGGGGHGGHEQTNIIASQLAAQQAASRNIA